MTGAMRMPLLAALALAAGCGDNPAGEDRVCPAVVTPSLQVEVVDAATGANLVPGAAGRWISGADTGELQDVDFSSRYLVGFGPAGRYGVVVQHAGYAAWARDDLRVERGPCGPETLSLRAELRRDGTVPDAGAMPAR